MAKQPVIQNDDRAWRLARALGWFSIGLGVLELAAPGRLARLVGVGEHRTLLRAYGAREVATGIGLLTPGRRAGWLWARVAGDALDLASLGRAATADGTRRRRIALAAAAVAGVAALDLVTARSLSQTHASS